MRELENSHGLYLGRAVFGGMSEHEEPVLAYMISGRSESSRQRYAIREKKDDVISVKVKPTPGFSGGDPELLHYTAVIVDEDTKSGIVSNGRQTDNIADRGRVLASRGIDHPLTKAMIAALNDFGPEPDSLKTPRIACVLNSYHTNEPRIFKWNAGLGIITKPEDAKLLGFTISNLLPQEFLGMATYTGDRENPSAPDLHEELVSITMRTNLSGSNAREIADSLFTWAEPELVVSTVAAVIGEDNVDVAVKNKHEF